MEQYGFRTNWTTESATFKLTNVILNAINNKLMLGVFSVIRKKLLIM
jgi:hypothetical protein